MEFGFASTGDSIVEAFHKQVEGRTFLITGPSPGGIGAETALSLARGKPSRLVLAGRSKSKIQPLIQEINERYPDVTTDFITLDLGSLASARQAAADIQAVSVRLDVLILNAAIMATPFQKTADGFEGQFGTNHLGHFLFANLLLPLIPPSAHPESRIVVVSSSAHALTETNFDGKSYAYNVWESSPAWQTSTDSVILESGLIPPYESLRAGEKCQCTVCKVSGREAP
jgi:NAD(P)-dependent dehydrogenase (short-subunit alcohol dehydrogenase family)